MTFTQLYLSCLLFSISKDKDLEDLKKNTLHIFKNKVFFKNKKITLLLTDNSWVFVTNYVTENLVSQLKNPTQLDYFFCQYLACIEA